MKSLDLPVPSIYHLPASYQPVAMWIEVHLYLSIMHDATADFYSVCIINHHDNRSYLLGSAYAKVVNYLLNGTACAARLLQAEFYLFRYASCPGCDQRKIVILPIPMLPISRPDTP